MIYIDTLYIYVALGASLKPSATLAIFGVPAEDTNLTRKQLNIIAFVSLLAPRHILHWNSNTLPTAAQWLQDVILFLQLEKM